MKRAVAVVLAVMVLLLCGCSNKVEEAQMLFDAGDYQGAIEVADSALDEDADADLIAEAKEIKANAIYELQMEAYNNGEWEESLIYHRKMLNEGQNEHFFKMSQKLSCLAQAEQYFSKMQSYIDSNRWDDIIYVYEQISDLSLKESFYYQSNDWLNIRMDEIVAQTAPIADNAKKNKLYNKFVVSAENGNASVAVEAAEEIHNGWPGSDEDIEAQERLPELIEQVEAEEAEAAARAEEEREAREQRLKDTIRVRRVWTSNPDSAGGVELYINFTNMSDKTIKYVRFGVKLYNAVGDVVECKYDNALFGVYYCKDTGPYEKGEGLSGTSWHWGDFYNWDIDHAELVSVEIEYMDGTETEIDGDDIDIIQY